VTAGAGTAGGRTEVRGEPVVEEFHDLDAEEGEKPEEDEGEEQEDASGEDHAAVLLKQADGEAGDAGRGQEVGERDGQRQHEQERGGDDPAADKAAHQRIGGEEGESLAGDALEKPDDAFRAAQEHAEEARWQAAAAHLVRRRGRRPRVRRRPR
jgi:hypothetical protein